MLPAIKSDQDKPGRKVEMEVYAMKTLEVCRCKLVMENEMEYIGTVSCSDDVIRIGKDLGFDSYSEEYFGLFCLNSKGTIIAYHEVSHGDLCSSITHPREVFKRALLNNASSIIIIHNHQSGNANPSDTDIATTRRLIDAGELLGIPVLDHIIIGAGGESRSLKANGEI